MVENCEKNIKLEEKNEWQAWKNQGNRGNRWENEEETLEKPWERRKRFEKKT